MEDAKLELQLNALTHPSAILEQVEYYIKRLKREIQKYKPKYEIGSRVYFITDDLKIFDSRVEIFQISTNVRSYWLEGLDDLPDDVEVKLDGRGSISEDGDYLIDEGCLFGTIEEAQEELVLLKKHLQKEVDNL